MTRLLDEVKRNQVQCIIVKDLSRFSRDYIELGTYMNQILPFMGVRLIAVADHYDSRNHKGSTIELDTAFKTLLNDLYIRDISVKVRASLEKKHADGEYAFGQVPFGYEKGTGKKNEVVVNEKESAVVRRIHEPLVILEEFQKAACSASAHSTKRKREKHPLVGRLSCGGCGYAMVYKPLRPGNKYRRFECSWHAILKIPECCTCFQAEMLEETVLSMINKELMLRGEADRQKTWQSFRKLRGRLSGTRSAACAWRRSGQRIPGTYCMRNTHREN